MNLDEDKFNVLRKLNHDNNLTQRELSKSLNLSLGKINYCLKALKEKGLVKICNFKNNSNKIIYFHILTSKGILTKTRLTINFMKKKMQEYDDLKKDIEKLKKNYKN
tara:strand:- start:139 stop:459 length:321 start_codon:yes stop_codon:yes gene_type:complete